MHAKRKPKIVYCDEKVGPPLSIKDCRRRHLRTFWQLGHGKWFNINFGLFAIQLLRFQSQSPHKKSLYSMRMDHVHISTRYSSPAFSEFQIHRQGARLKEKSTFEPEFKSLPSEAV